MTLQSIDTSGNRFCGPAALAAIAGLSTLDAARVIAEVIGSEKPEDVTGVFLHDLLAAFVKLGFKWKSLPVKGSLFYWMKTQFPGKGIYLIMIPHHFLAIEVEDGSHVYLIDNHIKKPISLSSSIRLNQRVVAAMRLSK